MPGNAEARLDVIGGAERAWFQTKHGIPAKTLADCVAHRVQAREGIPWGFVAQPIVQSKRAVELPCVLNKEKVVIPLVILDGTPSRQWLVDVCRLGEVLYKVIQGCVAEQTADGGKEEALYVYPPEVSAELDGGGTAEPIDG